MRRIKQKRTAFSTPPTLEELDESAPQTTKGELAGWYGYDFANSVFFNSVLLAFLPPFLTMLAKNAEGPDHKFTLFGLFDMSGVTYYPTMISASVVCQLVTFLLFGTIADFGAGRKQALMFTAVCGALACCAFIFVTDAVVDLAGILLIVSNVMMGLSVLYYNAYLPLLVASTPEVRISAGSAEYDDVRNAETNRLSNRGYAWGYLGGVILLVINVGIAFGFSPGCMQWCDDCPSDWSPWAYNIDNETLVSAGFASYIDPYGTSFAWPGVNPPCDTELDESGQCVARAAYRCDATGCVNITAHGSCAPDGRNRCDEDDLLPAAREDEYCTDEACPTFRCARRDCGRNFDAATCDPAAWILRINLLLGGVWWLGFGVLSIRRLEVRPRPPLPPGKSHLREGVRRTVTTVRKARRLPNVFRFLIAYWLYSDGLQALMTGAVLIASEPPVSMTATDLGILVLMTNFVGMLSVMAFDWFSRRVGSWYIESERGLGKQQANGRIPTIWISKYILVFNLSGILLLPFLAIFSLRTKTEFFLVAGFMYSTNMASMQSFSRSLVSSFTPRGLEGEFSSFMQLTDRGTSFLSPLLLAIVANETGSIRLSLFFVSFLIVIGAAILTTVDTEEAVREANDFTVHDVEDSEDQPATGMSDRDAILPTSGSTRGSTVKRPGGSKRRSKAPSAAASSRSPTPSMRS